MTNVIGEELKLVAVLGLKLSWQRHNPRIGNQSINLDIQGFGPTPQQPSPMRARIAHKRRRCLERTNRRQRMSGFLFSARQADDGRPPRRQCTRGLQTEAGVYTCDKKGFIREPPPL